jgi:hypothetical protein
MIKTEFNHLIEADQYHGKYALKGKSLGVIQLWAWNNCYLFLNYDTGKPVKISIEDISKLKIISHEEERKLYKEKNYPDEVFDNHYCSEHHEGHFFKGNKELYSDRDRQYGLIHDKMLKLHFDHTTNKIWTVDFCRGVAYMIASYYFQVKIMEKYGTLVEAKKDPEFEELFRKYFMSKDGDDVYSKYCDKMGVCDKIAKLSEKEIIHYINKVKQLPVKLSKAIFKSSNKIGGSKEFKYYFEKSNNVIH